MSSRRASAANAPLVQLSKSAFGTFVDGNGKTVEVSSFSWTNHRNTSVRIITYGGTLASVVLPDTHGNLEEVLLGYEDITGYMSPDNRSSCGASLGRSAHRIKDDRLVIDNLCYTLDPTTTSPKRGFDAVNWEAYTNGNRVTLSHSSADGDGGYPGDVLVNATYELNEMNEFSITVRASTTKPTYVNLANNLYWNFGGEMHEHVFTVCADRVLDVDADGFPTGKLLDVHETPLDLRCPQMYGDLLGRCPDFAGFDHLYSVYKNLGMEVPVARLSHPESGRALEVFSTLPSVRVHTVDGFGARRNEGIGLVPMSLPDKKFGNRVLYPGEEYGYDTTLKFSVRSKSVTFSAHVPIF